jgi:hypothetical protein
MGENSEMLEFVIPLLNHFELPQLRSEVEAVLRNKKTRQIFQTMKFHFRQSYGTLIKLNQGGCRFPPPKQTFFLPPLSVDKYRNAGRPILFYNDEHFFAIDFKSFKFEEYSVFVDPNPVYDPEANFIIRDVSSNVCRIQAKFLYQDAKHAKLSSADTNNLKRYMFLLIWGNMYFRVLAIYPKETVSKVIARETDKNLNSLS